MKYFMCLLLTIIWCTAVIGQEYAERIAPVQFHTADQDGITLSDTYGESVVSSGAQQDIIIVSGYYPGPLADSTTSVEGQIGLIEGLLAYPNPTSDATVLQLDRNHGLLDVTVYRQDGLRLSQYLWSDDVPVFHLNFEQLASNTYVVVVYDRALHQQSVVQIIRR